MKDRSQESGDRIKAGTMENWNGGIMRNKGVRRQN
jgi:hypothetical protein